jgi:replicative DNA helicase Mcm
MSTKAPKPTEEFVQFFQTYYHEQLGRFLEQYPDRRTFRVSYQDVFRWDSDLAEDWLSEPGTVAPWFESGLAEANTAGIDIGDVECVLVDLPEHAVVAPDEIRNEHAGQYLGVRGDLSRITTPDDFARVIVWECQRCGTPTEIPQTGDDLQEPHQCAGCERQGPFEINEGGSEFVDYSKVRIETPPEDAGTQGSESIDGYVTGDLVEYGHEQGLVQRAGDRATVYGQIERVPKTNGRQKKPLFERRFDIQAIEFDAEDEQIDVDAHLDTFEDLAAREDAVELFKQSLAPELFATDAWQAALELGVAYLFGAPRLDIENGPTYRGDIHALLVTDYGMGKSTFNDGVEQFSPKAIQKSATGLSSDVGLLAAAVKDDFGEGQWTIKPGILVRGNGGHVILDEIDKPDADLSRMNDALEGSQKVDIEKAGQSATYQSRIGLLATGNPEDSRYNAQEAIAHQIGIDETLLSRFDGIVTMRDTPDTDTDAKIAERIIDGIVEASEVTNADREEFDVLERPVPVEVGRAWIKHAREHVYPTARKDQLEAIKEWYADEVRQLNNDFAGNGEGGDMPVPVTARVVENCYRFAAAFARLHLRDEIADVDVERAKDLAKRLISQNWQDGEFVPPEVQEGTQNGKIRAVFNVVDNADEPLSAEQIEQRSGVDSAPHYIDKLKQEGELMEPQTGRYRSV